MEKPHDAAAWVALLCCLVLSGCMTWPSPPAAAVRTQLHASQTTGALETTYSLLGRALCENPQAHDVPRLVHSLVETWIDLGGRGAVQEALPCHLLAPWVYLVDGYVAAAQARWEDADILLAEAQSRALPTWSGDLLMRRAQVALHRGQRSVALALLAEAQSQEPHRVDIRLWVAQAYSGQGHWVDAVAALQPILQMRPSTAELGRARSLLEDAVKGATPPLSAADKAALAELATGLEAAKLSSEEVRRLVALGQTLPHPNVSILAGWVALRHGALERGMALLTAAQQRNPLAAEPLQVLGAHYAGQQQWLQAVVPMQEAARRDPFNVQIWGLLAPTATMAGELSLALQAYEALGILEPTVLKHQQQASHVRQLLQKEPAPPSPDGTAKDLTDNYKSSSSEMHPALAPIAKEVEGS